MGGRLARDLHALPAPGAHQPAPAALHLAQDITPELPKGAPFAGLLGGDDKKKK